MDYNEKYLKYKEKYIKLKQIYDEKIKQKNQMLGGGGKTEVYLFKADWCPHCQAFKSTWEKLQSQLHNKYVFVTVDSEKDKDKIQKFNIQGFPTIIKIINNVATEYVGPRDEKSVKDFITS